MRLSAGGTRRPKALGRGAWSTVDQALNSCTNFAVNIIAIHRLNLSALGSFGVAFTMYTLGWGISRAFASEPLLVRWSDRPVDEWRRGSADSLAAAGAVGLVALAVGVALAPVLDAATGRAMLAIAVFMPGLLVQDAVRLAFFARGRPQSAAVNDLLWAVFLVPTYLVVAATGRVTPAGLLVAWGAAGTLAAVVGFVQLRVLPSWRGPARWWRTERDLGVRYVAEFASQSGLLRLSDYGVAVIAGLPALALFRTASVLMGPVRIAITGLALHAIGEGARQRAFRIDAARRATLLRYAASITAVGLAWTAVVLLLPTSLAVRVIGDQWLKVRPIFAIASLGWIGFSIFTVSMVQLRIVANARQSLRAQLMSSVPLVGSILVGAVLDGARGAAVGLAAGYAVGAFIWWRHLVDAPSEVPAGSALAPDVLTPGESLL